MMISFELGRFILFPWIYLDELCIRVGWAWCVFGIYNITLNKLVEGIENKSIRWKNIK